MPVTARCSMLANELGLIRQIKALSRTPEQPARLNSPAGPTLNFLFFLTVQNDVYVGRKLLTQTTDRGWQQSSCLLPDHLLGKLFKINYGDSGFSITFKPLAEVDKNNLFEAAIHHSTSDIFFPFPLLDSTGQECVLSQADWADAAAQAEQLDQDERHFRDYCTTFLKPLMTPNTLLYDPACSTGTFIGCMARAFPETHCIGSDHSPAMIEHARLRHPALEFHNADAATMVQTVSRCDVLFLRFLNAEVLYRDDAHDLFCTFARALKPGALLIMFGHTPVLVNVSYWAKKLGLTLKSSLAAREGHLELFEFYVLEAQP